MYSNEMTSFYGNIKEMYITSYLINFFLQNPGWAGKTVMEIGTWNHQKPKICFLILILETKKIVFMNILIVRCKPGTWFENWWCLKEIQ